MVVADLVFLSPLAGTFALAAIVPVLAFVQLLRRDRRVRAVLQMSPLRRRDRVTGAASLAVLPVLLALAATQPVLELGRERLERKDAEVYVVFDTSRSMLAASGPAQERRLERAERLARELRARLPEVRVGIASFTDRVLPHLFPSVDQTAFAATVSRSIAIEQPPPGNFYSTRATRLDALSAIATRNFFAPTARYRLAVVFTDGESAAPTERLGDAFSGHRASAIFVHVWAEDERVYGLGGKPEPDYRADPTSRAVLQQTASAVRGRVFGEDELDQAVQAAEARLGPTDETRVRTREQVALAPWITLVAFLPLGLVLVRRNV